MFAKHFLKLKIHPSFIAPRGLQALFLSAFSFFFSRSALPIKFAKRGSEKRDVMTSRCGGFRPLDGCMRRFSGKWFLHQGREYVYKGRKRNSTTDDVERETTLLGFFFQYVYYFLNNNFNRSLYIFQSFYIRWIVV